MNKLAIAALLAATAYQPAHAKMQAVLPDNTTTAEVIAVEGRIEYGDDVTFGKLLSAVAKRGHSIRGVWFDSEGGNVIAAAGIADLIHHNNYNTYVHEGSVCASACFLSWAAGKTRYFRGNAKIGVHNVTIDGKEDADAAKVTIVMIQALKDFGVTPNILGKLASTSASDVAWLSQSELTAMGATYLPPLSAAQPVTAQSNTVAPPAEGSQPVQAPKSANAALTADGESINPHGSWKEFCKLATQWSANDHNGQHNTQRTNRKDGSYVLDLSYKGQGGKWVMVTENHATNGEVTGWFCVFSNDTHKTCIGWGQDGSDSYAKIGNRWVKQ